MKNLQLIALALSIVASSTALAVPPLKLDAAMIAKLQEEPISIESDDPMVQAALEKHFKSTRESQRRLIVQTYYQAEVSPPGAPLGTRVSFSDVLAGKEPDIHRMLPKQCLESYMPKTAINREAIGEAATGIAHASSNSFSSTQLGTIGILSGLVAQVAAHTYDRQKQASCSEPVDACPSSSEECKWVESTTMVLKMFENQKFVAVGANVVMRFGYGLTTKSLVQNYLDKLNDGSALQSFK